MYEIRRNEHDNKVTKDSSVFSWYYRQYCLVTGLYMLEPWERSLFNCLLFSVCALVICLSYKLYRLFLDYAHLFVYCFRMFPAKIEYALSKFRFEAVVELSDSDSLLLFINQCFAPSPDQTVRNLKDCFAPGDSKLVINYSKTQAWG
ncbi:autophagy protein Apg12 [Onchocerca flexuosa]|uniref:Autophagy protein Apg12 n=1 Tax=Onchocerca flexuosa TaxID=387005 RepID=A0A238BVN4_9BILA|nr:autophagy protein Apg12 [Onchocerca flexuosa]